MQELSFLNRLRVKDLHVVVYLYHFTKVWRLETLSKPRANQLIFELVLDAEELNTQSQYLVR